MKYAVVWKPEAERRLAELWVNAAHRSNISNAANIIDKKLQGDPWKQGFALYRQRRFLLVPPHSVIFDIHQQDRIVQVLVVWQHQPGTN